MGTYCPSGSTIARECTGGTWSRAIGRTTPCTDKCKKGHYCEDGSVTKTGGKQPDNAVLCVTSPDDKSKHFCLFNSVGTDGGKPGLTHTEAQEKCEEVGMELAELRTDAERAALNVFHNNLYGSEKSGEEGYWNFYPAWIAGRLEDPAVDKFAWDGQSNWFELMFEGSNFCETAWNGELQNGRTAEDSGGKAVCAYINFNGPKVSGCPDPGTPSPSPYGTQMSDWCGGSSQPTRAPTTGGATLLVSDYVTGCEADNREKNIANDGCGVRQIRDYICMANHEEHIDKAQCPEDTYLDDEGGGSEEDCTPCPDDGHTDGAKGTESEAGCKTRKGKGGGAAGAIIGGGVGGLIVLIAIFYCMCCKKKKPEKVYVSAPAPAPQSSSNSTVVVTGGGGGGDGAASAMMMQSMMMQQQMQSQAMANQQQMNNKMQMERQKMDLEKEKMKMSMEHEKMKLEIERQRARSMSQGSAGAAAAVPMVASTPVVQATPVQAAPVVQPVVQQPLVGSVVPQQPLVGQVVQPQAQQPLVGQVVQPRQAQPLVGQVVQPQAQQPLMGQVMQAQAQPLQGQVLQQQPMMGQVVQPQQGMVYR